MVMTTAPAFLPDQLAAAEGELPEEIIVAIGNLIDEAKFDGGRFSISDGKDVQARSTILTTAILSRLTAAEAQRDAALARAERAEKDAARFQALMRCGRIKPQGSAGVDTKTGERTYPDEPGSVHFGAEFWVQPEERSSNLTIWGRHCLSALADDILAYEAAGREALSREKE
jgi:hypothetical protein